MDDSLSVGELDFAALIGHEWLATNQLGGYASSSLCGLNTRKYHGLLVAAMSPPVRRMVLLSRVDETLVNCDGHYDLSSNEYPGAIHPQGYKRLRAFSNEPFPRWAWQGGGCTIEKQLRLLPGQNTVVLSYTLLGGGNAGAELELRPLFALRPIHELTFQWNASMTVERRGGHLYRVTPTTRTPEVFFAHAGTFDAAPLWYLNTIYRREEERGYSGLEDLWCPGVVRLTLAPGKVVHFACSSEPMDLAEVVQQADQVPAARSAGETVAFSFARSSASTTLAPAAERLLVTHDDDEKMDALLRAVDQFRLRIPRETAGEVISACASGYPWPAPSGRAALIAFSGAYLVPGHFVEARALLGAFAGRMRDGLLPSEFPEDGSSVIYRGADCSLWFINALHHYVRYTGDLNGARPLLDGAIRMLELYRHGTELGIIADAEGLLSTRAPGIPTTWMDARIGDWVITPRAGRPVELNALWYSALCIVAELCERLGLAERCAQFTALARLTHNAFNRRFWNERAAPAGCCFDVVGEHGNDPSVRPNQLFALSLPFPVLSFDRHAAVLETVRRELLTPFGIRTLSPADPAYAGRSSGNVHARDRAYHGGSAYPWLLGPYATALLRVKGRSESARQEARQLLDAPLHYLRRDGVGQLCELFDGDAPQRPGGAVASATAVAELLRAYAEEVLNLGPGPAASMSLTVTDLAVVRPESRIEHPA